jgi:hypothetical protein
MMLTGAGRGAPPATYTGPGDVVSGAVYWYGLRGYSAAYSTGTNPAVDLVDQAGANPITINIKSDGTLDVAAIATWVAAHTVTTIKVTKLYDQSGNAAHGIQATLAAMPVLTLNVIGVRPALTFSGGQSVITGTVTTVSQPWTVSGSTRVTAATGSYAGTFGTNVGWGSDGGTNQIDLQAGADFFLNILTPSTFQVVQGVANGVSSTIKVDNGSLNTGSAGTNGLGTSVIIGSGTFSNRLTGDILNIGFWPSAISSGNQTSLYNQDKAYWGF